MNLKSNRIFILSLILLIALPSFAWGPIGHQAPETQKKGGLVEALYVAEDNLRAIRSTPTEKKNALKFLIHFIADLHQPLHTAYTINRIVKLRPLTF